MQTPARSGSGSPPRPHAPPPAFMTQKCRCLPPHMRTGCPGRPCRALPAEVTCAPAPAVRSDPVQTSVPRCPPGNRQPLRSGTGTPSCTHVAPVGVAQSSDSHGPSTANHCLLLGLFAPKRAEGYFLSGGQLWYTVWPAPRPGQTTGPMQLHSPERADGGVHLRPKGSATHRKGCF